MEFSKFEHRTFLVIGCIMVMLLAGIFLWVQYHQAYILQSVSRPQQISENTQTTLEDQHGEIELSASSIRFSEEISRGELFEKEISEGLVFRLIPGSGGIADWTISIGDKTNPENNFSGVVTPPYRGMNYIYIAGWHFRNSDNTGPNELGPKNVNAPGTVREFFFVTNKADAEEAARLLDKILWPATERGWEELDKNFALHEAIPKGKGLLTITDMKLDNLIVGEQAWIEHMKFEVELTFSRDIDTSDWKTYRSEEYGYSLLYPLAWIMSVADDEERKKSEWVDLVLWFIGPKQDPRNEPLMDGISIKVWFAQKDDAISLAEWLEKRDAELECRAWDVQAITKQEVLGLRREEGCFGWHLPETSYYIPLENRRVVLVFSYSLSNSDPAIEGDYERLAETAYAHLQLPLTE